MTISVCFPDDLGEQKAVKLLCGIFDKPDKAWKTAPFGDHRAPILEFSMIKNTGEEINGYYQFYKTKRGYTLKILEVTGS